MSLASSSTTTDSFLEELTFHLELQGTITIDDTVYPKLWKVWSKLGALKVTATILNNQLEISVFFARRRDMKSARKKTSKNSMYSLLWGNPSPKASTTDNYDKFLGPNGQPQRNVEYKPQVCPFGCGAVVREEHVEEHRQYCSSHSAYLQFKSEYESSKMRIAEQPSPAQVVPKKGKLKNRKYPYGFIYGKGPLPVEQVTLSLKSGK